MQRLSHFGPRQAVHQARLSSRAHKGHLLLLLALALLARGSSAANSTDADLLRAFKLSLNNPTNPALDSWADDSSNPCDGWAGVTCDGGGNVVELNLTASGLEGTMPKAGWAFPNTLVRIDLSDNSLTGPISPKWRLPEALQLLDMRYNLLTSTVPGAWALPDQLLELKLTDNFFAGVAPDWALPPSLETLLLAYNSVPTIPPAWADHKKLRFLDLTNADIAGPFPGQSLPASLQELRLPLNYINGSVPTAELLPLALESLWLGGNALSGSLPEAWLLPGSLKELRLDNNPGLEGPLPASWAANLTELSLFLFNNSMTGTLPAWGDAEGVSIAVTPGNNWTCGEVPSSPTYTSASNFVERLSGYTVSLAPLEQLPDCGPAPAPAPSPGINATDAELLLGMKATFANGDALLPSWTGDDPCDGWIGVTCDNEGNVFIVSLSRGLRGSIPAGGWVLPPKLAALDLSRNELTGTFPESWQLPLEMSRLELDYNQLNGTLPAQLLLPDTVSRLYLSKNRLTGTLPPAWQLPTQLMDLGLDNNQLTGTIPSGWSLPTTLDTVYLFNNSLTGTLPGYPKADSIRFFVSPGNAKLCGEVPFSPQYWWVGSPDYGPGGPSGSFGALNESSLEACPVPASPSPPTQPPESTSSGSNTGLVVGAVVGAVCALVAAAALAWWCWRRKRQPSSSPELLKADSKGALKDSANEQAALPFDDPLLSVLLTKLGPKIDEKLPKEEDWTLATAVTAGTDGEEGPQRSDFGSGTGEKLVNPKAWTLSFHDLELIKPIGEGSFGRVYLGRYFETQVAVKILLNTGIGLDNAAAAAEMALSLSNPILYNLQQEATLMASLRHPNIVGFLGVCPLPPIVVTEFCSRGSLTDVLRAAKASRSKGSQLDWARRISMAMDAAKGMLYLHSRSPPILHRDLKSPNLLVDKHWSVKVCDFNLSKIMEESVQVATSMAASNPRWLAPEILDGQGATFSSDVYSFGVVLWELLTWELPWMGTNQFQVIKAITSGGRPPIPPHEQLPDGGGGFERLDGYCALMDRCWAQDPAQRPTFTEVIAELRALAAEVPRKGSKRDVAPEQQAAEPSSSLPNAAGDSATSSQVGQRHNTRSGSATVSREASLGASLEGSMPASQLGSASASREGGTATVSTLPSIHSGAQHSGAQYSGAPGVDGGVETV